MLDGDTVQYGHWDMLEDEIGLLVRQEQNYDYADVGSRGKIEHVVNFASKLWVQHAFLEGNTRTLAIFVIKYLRSIGFSLDNQPFEDNSWYFRNALVRANYRNGVRGVHADDRFMKRFFGNLLLGEHNELKNRTLHILWESAGEQAHETVNETVNETTQAVLALIAKPPCYL